ncbi:MAG: hypothetical protein ACM3X6_12810 [Patescibacteria group bacterium]
MNLHTAPSRALQITEHVLPDSSTLLSIAAGDGLPYLLWETGTDAWPRDWSGHTGFEFQAANLAERVVYLIWRFYDHDRYTKEGPLTREASYNVLIGLLPGVTTTVTIPIACFDSRGRFPARPPGTGVIYAWGQGMDPSHITAFRLFCQALEETVTVALSGPRLVKGAPALKPPAGGPVVDRFGQWNRKEWPGKIHTEDELAAAMRAEDRDLAAARAPEGRGAYGGYTARRFPKSGFFRIEREPGGRFWLVDPEGCAFFSTGLDCTRPWSEGPVMDEHLPLFEEAPAREQASRAPDVMQYSPYTENLKRVYGQAWHEAWAEQVLRRHRAWGFNTIGNWSDEYLTGLGRMPYVVPLREPKAAGLWRGFPDVCAPEFADVCADFAAQAGARRDDPMLVGHFLGNEPGWCAAGFILAERLLAGPDSHTRTEIIRRLAESRGGDLPALNAAWGTAFGSWSDLGRAPWPDGRIPDAAKPVLREISGELVELYYTGLCNALRRVDPNHLILGIRFAGLPAEEYCLRGMEACDVASINIYDHEPRPDALRRLHEASRRPVMVGEFHFAALGYGAIANGLCAVRTDRDKGLGYRYFVERFAAMPFTVGLHWFQFVDEPCFGRFDGENYACGFVDVTNRPYPELVDAAIRTHAGLYAVLTGERPPTDEKPAPAKTGIYFGNYGEA